MAVFFLIEASTIDDYLSFKFILNDLPVFDGYPIWDEYDGYARIGEYLRLEHGMNIYFMDFGGWLSLPYAADAILQFLAVIGVTYGFDYIFQVFYANNYHKTRFKNGLN